MFTKTFSATLLGLKPIKVEVEVNGTRGIPNLVIVGLPSKAVNEAKERVTAAITSLGVRLKSLKTVVNLAPADIRKDSSHLEFAIAVGLLQMNMLVPQPTHPSLFLGELSLDGTLKPVRGALPLVLAATELGIHEVFLPQANLAEVRLVKNTQLYGIQHLQEYFDHARGHRLLHPAQFPTPAKPKPNTNHSLFSTIQGQQLAKRALVISAAGGHNLLMVGPPGTGKSTLAESLPELLPDLSEAESLEVTSLYSIAGCLPQPLLTTRPFRSPHHTTTTLGLLGGGNQLRPGEITLAHRGVLFLDEVTQFRRQTLEALRLPLEKGEMTFANAFGQHTFPARFTLVAAANPCSCGYEGSSKKVCSCSLAARLQYQQRVSGPILDRIDLHVTVPDLEFTTRISTQNATTLSDIHSLVKKSRQIQAQRYAAFAGPIVTAHLPAKAVFELCPMSSSAERLLIKAANSLQLSGRSYLKTIKVSRTIADLAVSSIIEESHIAEALQFRTTIFTNTS